MSRLFLTGDVHGNPAPRFAANIFEEGNYLTPEDMVIVLGDFGLYWSPTSSSHYKAEHSNRMWLNNKRWRTYFIDGNHEGFPVLNEMMKLEWDTLVCNYVMVDTEFPKIRRLLRGYEYVLNGYTTLAIGGAASWDKESRVEHISWWKEELLSHEEEERVLSSCKHYDLVLTHTPPTNIKLKNLYGVTRDECPVAKFFQFLVDEKKLTFDKWFYGHMHRNSIIDSYYGLYENVVEIL